MRIVFASENKNKFNEVVGFFRDIKTKSGQAIELIRQGSMSVVAAAEMAPTFVENAIIKARNASYYTNLPALADDSGLEVSFLKGAPGVSSARYADKGSGRISYSDNVSKLLTAMQNASDDKRTARFQCVMVFLRHAYDPTPIICQGTWEGSILREARGTGGFGYDPVFFVPTHNCSAAELALAVKNQISHRALALKQFLQFITTSTEF